MNMREKAGLYDAIKIAGKSEEEYVKQVKVWKDKAKKYDELERITGQTQSVLDLEDSNKMWKERAEGFIELANTKADLMVENEELKEDSKKYKLLMSANSQVVKDNITMSEYQEEITHLKERLEKDHQIIVNANIEIGEKHEAYAKRFIEQQQEVNNLKFRLADEQDEINRINGERRNDAKIVSRLKDRINNDEPFMCDCGDNLHNCIDDLKFELDKIVEKK